MARAYYLAPSLATLRSEVNRRWPGRSKRSDGWIGDAAHAARASDHNPNSRGSVNALDITRQGVDTDAILAACFHDQRVNYVIFDRVIYSRSRGFTPRTYTGSNPHTGHVHISILQTRTAEQDTRPWGIHPATRPGPPTTGVNPDNRTPIERLLDTMDEKTLRGIIRTEARNALYSPLAEEKSGDSAVDGSINNAIWHAARTVDTVALVREGVRQELWAALIPDHDGIPGSSIRNNLLHQTNASVSTLALVRQLAQREGVDVDEAAIVQGLTEALAPVIRSLVAEEAGDDIAERVVARIGAALTQD